MSKYYELIKEAKPKNRAKKVRFDSSQQIYFASCRNYIGVEILGVASGLLLTLADGQKTLAEIAKELSSTLHVAENSIKEVIVIEVRNLQRKHLLYLEV
ncbi:MAG: hypothetical protein IJT06_02400 [Selenomonadaceae bacterium]|nr:hypothetical protein [Selenomonadaceae bacterium]